MIVAERAAPFQDVPQTAAGHIALYFHAAAARVMRLLEQLSAEGSSEADRLVERHSFLHVYVRELQAPGAGTDCLAVESALADWERACDRPLPLHALASMGLTLRQRIAFAIAALPEEDPRFGPLFAELQGDTGGRRPTVSTMGRLLTDGGLGAVAEDGWRICAPLVTSGLLSLDQADVPRSEQGVRVPLLVWDAARGEVSARPLPGGTLRPIGDCPRVDGLLYAGKFLERLERVPQALAQGRSRLVIVRHAPGVDVEEIAATLARRMDRGLLRLERSAIDAPSSVAVGPICSLARVMPLIEYELGPGEAIDPPDLQGYDGPMVVALGFEGGLRPEKARSAVTIDVPFPDAALRESLWRDALGDTALEDLQSVRDGLQIAGGYIRVVARSAAAQAALEGRERVQPKDVRVAARLLNRQLLDALAQQLAAQGRWDDLVASPLTRERLAELEQRCECRERLAGGIGRSFRASVGRGVRALFAGVSGTGKTMAARILAGELGKDLYRVDLAAIVNKYVGETEKNLHLVLTRAEALDVVLLLDEGDALLGHRTEVKSSTDRYANLETNYLLQRLESYEGIAIVTTNLGENIDPAFQRRMDVVVPFFPPRPDERRRIWSLHLPASHQIEPDWLERVVQRCALTGGQIRNAVLQAAALALQANGRIGSSELRLALLREYQKAGASFPLVGDERRGRRTDGGLNDFVTAMRAR